MQKKSRREREKESRLNAILDTAERVFAEKGYEYTTMDAIACEAEFTKRTVYGYFPGKSELFAAVTARALEVLVKMFEEAVAVENTGFDRISAIGVAYIRFFETYPRYFRILSLKTHRGNVAGKYSDEVKRLDGQMFSIITRSFEEGRADGSVRPDIDVTSATLHVISVSNGLLDMVSRIGARFPEQFGLSASEFIEKSMGLIGDSIRPGREGVSK